MTEIWLPIEGYENLYEVSNLGRVRRIESFVNCKAGSKRKVSGKILKPRTNTCGYLMVRLSKNGIWRDFLLHRLVSAAFIPNPNNLPQVNHLSEDKLNNSVENLEWCTAKENNNYGTRTKRASEKLQKPVLCVELNQIFPSLTEAARQLCLSVENLSRVLAGRSKTAGGYHWEFAETKTAS